MPVIIAIVLIATIAFMLNNQSAINVNQTGGLLQAEQAEQVAQAGLVHATWDAQNSGCAGDMSMTTVPFGQGGIGSYSTTVDAAATTTTQYNFNPDRDGIIEEKTPGHNHADADIIKVQNAPDDIEQALYHYDLSSIPTNQRVVTAIAWFYVDIEDPAGTVTLHPVTADWSEANLTWDAVGGKFESRAYGSFPPQPVPDMWVSVNVTALAQSWVSNPGNNYGFLLNATSVGVQSKYTSREYADASLRPYLEVTTADAAVSPLTITAIGTLSGNPSPANDISRKLARSNVPAYQPDSNLVLQPDAATGEDAYIWEWTKNTNYGTDDETWVSLANNSTSRSLFSFNLAGVPVGAKIVSATLSLHHQSGNNVDVPITAHRISNPWNEAFVTWNQRDNGINWNTAGGDFDASIISTTAVGPASNVRYEWDITSLVQGWTDSAYPNYGVALATARSNSIGERFYTSDETIVTRRPRLTVQYACECGSSCLAPQGSGRVGMVVINPTTLVPADATRKALFESWGYTVNLLGENSNAATYMSESANNDVYYISETVNSSQVGPRIKDVPIGVVSEDGDYNNALGFATGSAYTVGSALNVTDTSHYITALFPTGPLEIYSGGMEQLTVSGTEAPGLQTLADTGGAGSLVVLDKGADMAGSGTTAERRVMLPLGRVGKFNWDYLNGNGRLIVQRALQWGTGNLGGTPPPGLLFVVANDGGLTIEETAHQTLVESWGYVVELIDDDASQAEFDTAVAINDVVLITNDITASKLNTKLVNASIGVVTSEVNLSDEFGLSASVGWDSGTAIEINNNTHYITSPFPTGLLTVLTGSESLAYVSGILSPNLGKLASSTSGFGVVTLDAGATTHTGGTAVGRRVQLPWGGAGFDPNNLNADGKIILQRALEWGLGASGAPPQSILFVVPDATALGPQDTVKKTLMESWGFNVALITAADTQANFDTAVASADVAYISEEVTSSDVGTKLRGATIGVVNEETALTDEFGIAGVRTGYTGTDINVVNTTHYITSVFSGGPLTIASAATSLNRLTGSVAPGLNALAATTGNPELATIETGGALYDTGTAAGRRVQLPWGSDAFDINLLTADGQTLMRRAIEWGADTGSVPGPIAHWKLDDGAGTTAVDSEGGHDGTLTNGPAWVAGQIGDALNFDGVNEYVDVGTFDVSGSGLTMMGWFNADTIPTSDGRIISKANGLNATDAWWQLSTTDSGANRYLRMRIKAGGTTTTMADSTVNLSTGQWYFAVATYDNASGAMKLYLDGAEVKSGTHAVGGAVDTGPAVPIAIGANGTAERFFDGILDDVRVYDRALNATEISDLFTGGGGGGGGGSPTMVEVRVATGNDDAEERISSGNVNLTSSDLELISDGSNAQLVGMRFTGVAVPNGAAISNAWIQFQVDETNSGATNVNIQGEASDSALQFTTGNSNISSRGRTTASTAWAPVSWTSVGEAGPDQQTPDISAAIQEIVNRPGWVSGNDMVMIITGSGERTAESYNGSSTGAALLHIEY